MRSRFDMIVLTLIGLLGPILPAVSQEPLLNRLPPGVIIEKSLDVPPNQLSAIGTKLGGKINKLTNSTIRVHGRTIGVNVITSADAKSGDAIYKSLLAIKREPYCVRRGQQQIVEYVGNAIDEDLARKTSFELGVVPKPDKLNYRMVAKLATIDQADYMSCNPLFNSFLALDRTPDNQSVKSEIAKLRQQFKFGKTLLLRAPSDSPNLTYSFEPAVKSSKKLNSSTSMFVFDSLSSREQVPFVEVTIQSTVNSNGLLPDTSPPAAWATAATAMWPTKDQQVVELARQITGPATTRDAKVDAILKWLTTGKHIKYSGQTGSRWGTMKVLDQKFGHCWDFADCFVTLARAADIPTRQVAGWLYGSSGHVWAEYYKEGQGWQQVDPTGGGQLACGIYHIAFFTSEDGNMPIVYLQMPTISIDR